jgi:hypothetical protein
VSGVTKLYSSAQLKVSFPKDLAAWNAPPTFKPQAWTSEVFDYGSATWFSKHRDRGIELNDKRVEDAVRKALNDGRDHFDVCNNTVEGYCYPCPGSCSRLLLRLRFGEKPQCHNCRGKDHSAGARRHKKAQRRSGQI